MSDSIIAQIKKCIAFVFIKNGESVHPNGTGFFVSIPTGYDDSKSYKYFVTAKHVLQDLNGNFHPSIGIRINKQNEGSDIIWLQKDALHIYTHHDNDVDIALFPFVPDDNIYDYLSIGMELLSNPNIIREDKIEEGVDVLFTGLFTSHIGEKRNQPIVRFGKVALLSDEKVEWREENKPPQKLDLYLMECQSYGGNSGAPVFFKLDRLRDAGSNTIKGEQYYLAGIMKGYFNATNPIQVTQTDYQLHVTQNIGIAGVVPAFKLYEILHNDTLAKARTDNDAANKNKLSTDTKIR